MLWDPEGLSNVSLHMLLEEYKSSENNDEAEREKAEMTSYVRAGSVLIQVHDKGPGLTSNELKQLFHQGVQFNPNQLQAGQGNTR